MFEFDEDATERPDFDALADQLVEQGHEVSPAQIHGCLSAQLALSHTGEVEAAPVALQKALAIDVYGELAEQVMKLHAYIASSLVSEEFTYALLLPDDDNELPIRVEALGQWCEGFLAGFALAGDNGDAMVGDTREIIEDVTVITEVSLDEDAEEEESESSYMELVEYLRYCVMNLHAMNEDQATDGESLH